MATTNSDADAEGSDDDDTLHRLLKEIDDGDESMSRPLSLGCFLPSSTMTKLLGYSVILSLLTNHSWQGIPSFHRHLRLDKIRNNGHPVSSERKDVEDETHTCATALTGSTEPMHPAWSQAVAGEALRHPDEDKRLRMQTRLSFIW